MSGLFGLLDSQHCLPVERLLTEMGRAMSHREWYVVETLHEANIGLGRIGIGIFNREHQPVISEDGDLAVFLTGELERAAELRRALAARGGFICRDESDGELALRLYQTYGANFIPMLEGAFVLAIWNCREQELLIVNDRAGLYPLYYTHQAGCLIFAPEMKGVFYHPGFHRELDWVALAEYVRFQFLLGDKTFFQGLQLLPNATRLRYRLKTDTLTVQPYWDLSCLPELPASITLEEAAEEAGERLRGAVERLSARRHRLGLYLSGGVDSRVILGFIPPDQFPLNTVTYGMRGSRDVLYARQAAQALPRIEHHFFEFVDGQWVKDYADFHLTLTEGFHSWIHGHGIHLLGQARPLMEVNLTGLHGAELNWDDPILYGAPDDLAFETRLFHLLSQETTWPSLTEAEECLLFSPRLARQMRGLAFDSFQTELAKYSHWSFQQRAAQFSCAADRRLYQYYTVFHRSHVEQRFPFYDYRYFEFIHALPPVMLFERKLRRAIIRRQMPTLARIPYDKDNLPISAQGMSRKLAELILRGKSHLGPRFALPAPLNADYENWLRHELREWGEGILLGERTLQRDIFNPELLKALWNRHQAGLETNTIGKIAPLMTWEMMARKFFD